jgi:hypothetical protein
VQPTGLTAVTITSVALAGPHWRDFSVTDGCSRTEPLAAPCRIQVVFTASAVGARTAELVILRAGQDDPIAVALSGRGSRAPLPSTSSTAATTVTTAGPAPSAMAPSADVSAVDFGDQVIGKASTARTVTIRNDGPVDLAMPAMALTGGAASDFALSPTSCGTIAAGAACKVDVRLTARALGRRDATLEIPYPVPGSPLKVALTGVGRPKLTGMARIASGGYAMVDPAGRVFSFGSDACPAHPANPDSVGIATGIVLVNLVETLSCWVASAGGTVIGTEGTSPPPPGMKGVVVGINAGAPKGYRMVTSAGQVIAKDAPFLGDASKVALGSPIVAIERTSSDEGYWLLAADGGIFMYGDAFFHGSAAGKLQVTAVAIQRSAGGGYWIATADGAVYPYGPAVAKGDLRNTELKGPVVGMVATESGNGYWLLTADGRLHSFGDAVNQGTPP